MRTPKKGGGLKKSRVPQNAQAHTPRFWHLIVYLGQKYRDPPKGGSDHSKVIDPQNPINPKFTDFRTMPETVFLINQRFHGIPEKPWFAESPKNRGMSGFR